MSQKQAQRVVAYIDGFNLYFGLKARNYQRYYWLNVHELARHLLLPHQVLGMTKYFTARISGGKSGDSPTYRRERDAKRKRQTNYLDVLKTIRQIQIFEGQYYDNFITCSACQHTWNAHEEKMTDVNIATEMLCDAFDDVYDVALLISGDSDLVPPVRQVVTKFKDKRVVVACPPNRHSIDLVRAASHEFHIEKSHLKKSQMPETVVVNGFPIRRPSEWK